MIFLPFDHRKTFLTDILGLSELTNSLETDQIANLKWLIYQGFLQTWERASRDARLGLIVDEEFGAAVIADAQKRRIPLGVPIEKHGQVVFDFARGPLWSEAIRQINPDYVKVLVRYNPANQIDNKLQRERLEKVSDYCRENKRKLLFELLVPPTDQEKIELKDGYEVKKRAANTVIALQELQEVVTVNLWKLEGFDREGWEEVLPAIKGQVPVVVLGRGESHTRVNEWLAAASCYQQIVGFAVGRTIFLAPLQEFVAGRLTESAVITQITEQFTSQIEFWDRAKKQNSQIKL